MNKGVQQTRTASTYAEMLKLIADSNREMADKLREEARRIEQSDSFNHLFVGNGDPRRVMLTSSYREDDATTGCLLALIEVHEQLRDLEHGTVTIKIQDGLPVLVEIASKHKPTMNREA